MITVGRIVHYVKDGNLFPAIVVNDHQGDVADLMVFKITKTIDGEPKEANYAVSGVEHSKEHKEGHWTWPPRAYNQ